jgi:amino acid permease
MDNKKRGVKMIENKRNQITDPDIVSIIGVAYASLGCIALLKKLLEEMKNKAIEKAIEGVALAKSPNTTLRSYVAIVRR